MRWEAVGQKMLCNEGLWFNVRQLSAHARRLGHDAAAKKGYCTIIHPPQPKNIFYSIACDLPEGVSDEQPCRP